LAAHSRWFGRAPLFDPRTGTTVLEPPGKGAGYWAGAPSALYDDDTENFYLYYRLRVPLELGRGVECRVARSQDGATFTDIWKARKQDFDSPSVEKACLMKTPDGQWRLYLSYVDGADNRWRVDMMEAPEPGTFDPATRQKVFTAAQVGVEGVKDPVVLLIGHTYYMLLSYAPSPESVSDQQRAKMHATADVYNTGITRSCTALATSTDGARFEWHGEVFGPGESWDAYCGRLGGVVYLPPVFTVFYDGSASVDENYEEKTGLAMSLDLRHFERVSRAAPILTSPHASHSLRYIDAVQLAEQIYYYYEYARSDGSHELRLSRAGL
jgi:hypothetical protein